MEQYRREIKSKGDFNKVRKVLSESGLVTLAPYTNKGQSYILSGTVAMPTGNPQAYFDEVSKRKIGMLNSKSIRFDNFDSHNSFNSQLALSLDAILD